MAASGQILMATDIRELASIRRDEGQGRRDMGVPDRPVRILWAMGRDEMPLTGTCDLSTIGRRSGEARRIEIWYVIVDGQIHLTGTPGPRGWLANLRARTEALLHLRDPSRDLPVVAREVTDPVRRRQVAEEAGRLQPWYADQSYSIEDWVAGSPMVLLTPGP